MAIQGAFGWIAGAAIVAMALPVAASDGPSGPEPNGRSTFKSGVDVVALSVTVLDPQARLLAGLSRDKFSIFEDGIRQDIAYFETSEVPLDGTQSQGMNLLELRDVPPGLYEITATLVGSAGRLARATQMVKVMPSPGHSE